MGLLQRLFVLLGSIVPAFLLGIVLVIVSADVFARIVLSQSISISHDLAIVALAGVVWFGIVGIAANSELFGVQYFVERLPRRMQPVVTGAVHVIVIVIASAALRAAVVQVETARFTKFVALGWPKWIVSAGLAVAMAAVILIQLIRLYQLIRNPSDRSGAT